MSNKDQFNDGDDVNPSSNPHINDFLAARLSRNLTRRRASRLEQR